jgi:hypothetical protein
MQNSYQKKNWVWIGGLAFMAIIAIMTLSFRPEHSFRQSQNLSQDNDTTPRKSKSGSSVDRNRTRSGEMSDDDLESAIRDLQKKMAELQMQLSERHFYNHNFDQEMEEAKRENLDKLLDESMMRDKIRMETDMERAMRNYKLDKLRELDGMRDHPEWERSQLEMELAMRRAQADMGAQNSRNIKRQMELAQIEMQRNSRTMNRQMELAQRQMGMAKVQMEKARIDMKRLRSLISDLQKDGLIEKGKPYEVEVKDGNLYINGKKADQKTNDKYKNNPDYRDYFRKDGNFKFKSDGKEMNIGFNDDDVV